MNRKWAKRGTSWENESEGETMNKDRKIGRLVGQMYQAAAGQITSHWWVGETERNVILWYSLSSSLPLSLSLPSVCLAPCLMEPPSLAVEHAAVSSSLPVCLKHSFLERQRAVDRECDDAQPYGWEFFLQKDMRKKKKETIFNVGIKTLNHGVCLFNKCFRV